MTDTLQNSLDALSALLKKIGKERLLEIYASVSEAEEENPSPADFFYEYICTIYILYGINKSVYEITYCRVAVKSEDN